MTEKKAVYYRDKRIEDCSREELLAGIRWLMEQRDRERQWAAEKIEMERLFADVRYRLK